MKITGRLTSPARYAARWSRRLGVVAVVGAAGVAVTPAQSFAPAASVTAPQSQGQEAAGPGQEPAEAIVQASSTPAPAGPSVVDDVPAPALRAYRFAAAVLARTDADCGLDWSLLAAIGDVESDHGRYGNAVLGADGTSSPPILGPRLDGTGDVAAIADSDDGSLDSDTRWDRAVGPMQFIPSTWAVVGSDADGDGVRDPHDLDDAALSAAAYLCAGPGDLSTAEGQRAAVYRYNPSRAYVRLVLRLAAAYAQQNAGLALPTPGPAESTARIPTLTAPIERPAHPATPPRESPSATAPALIPASPDTRRGSSQGQHAGTGRTAPSTTTRGGTGGTPSSGPRGAGTGGSSPSTGGSGSGGTGAPADPAPSPAPPPSTGSGDSTGGDTAGGGTTTGGGSAGGSTGGGSTPPSDGGSSSGSTPPPPPPVSGALQRADDGTWSVGGTTVDFGDDAYLGSTALNDFDGADGIESNQGELETLVGQDVTVVLQDGGQVVVKLNDLAYR
jgi:membrane-bound lytic murein transglycosylase B